jgi:hypothetical protein
MPKIEIPEKMIEIFFRQKKLFLSGLYSKYTFACKEMI